MARRSVRRPAARNGAELWLPLNGAWPFRGSLRVISEMGDPQAERAESPTHQNLQRIASARTIARLMTIGRDLLTKAETVTVAAHRSWRTDPGRGPRDHRRIPHDASGARPKHGLTPSDRPRSAPVSLPLSPAALRTRSHSGGPCGNHFALVQRTALQRVHITRLDARLRRQMYGRGKSRSASSQTNRRRVNRELHQNCVRANIAGRMTTAT